MQQILVHFSLQKIDLFSLNGGLIRKIVFNEAGIRSPDFKALIISAFIGSGARFGIKQIQREYFALTLQIIKVSAKQHRIKTNTSQNQKNTSRL